MFLPTTDDRSKTKDSEYWGNKFKEDSIRHFLKINNHSSKVVFNWGLKNVIWILCKLTNKGFNIIGLLTFPKDSWSVNLDDINL